MTDKEQKLLIEMINKINESRTYNIIFAILTFLWLFEMVYFFSVENSNIGIFWSIWVVCVIGWKHIDKKSKNCIKEYNQLKKEYENLI